MTPLEIFQAIWNENIPPAVVTYVEAVNYGVDTNDLPDFWACALYQPELRRDVTMGSQPWVEETGSFQIGLLTRSGTGAASLDQAIDYVRQVFHGARRDGLLIVEVDGPHDIDPEGQGEWWEVGMIARYTFQTRRDGTDPLHGGWEGFPDTPPPPLPRP
jgi:hypothetical protein